MITFPTVQAVVIVAFLFCLALFGTYVVFKLLKSSASIKQKGLQIGGAAAGLVVIFILLNRYMPNIRAELIEDSSAQSIHAKTANGVAKIAEVSLSPSTQLISKQELTRLDRNAYDIRESTGLALPRPEGDSWEIGETTNVSTISVADVPALGLSLAMYRTVLSQSAAPIFFVRQRAVRTIKLAKGAAISGVPVTFNFFSDKRFVRAALASQMNMLAQLGFKDVQHIPDEILDTVQTQLLSQMDSANEAKLPIVKNIKNGVYVMPLTRAFLNESSLTKIIPFSRTILDDALTYLAVAGYYLPASTSSLYVNQQSGIASFNFSTAITNVDYNGKKSDLIINNIGFIVAGADRAIFVLLIYSSTDDVQTFENLQKILNDLRFSA